MDRKSADALLDVFAQMDTPINRLWQNLVALEDPTERERFKNHFTALMLAYTEMQDEITDAFPELEPTGEGEQNWYQLRKKYETPDFPVRMLSEAEKLSAEQAGDETSEQIQKENDEPPNE